MSLTNTKKAISFRSVRLRLKFLFYEVGKVGLFLLFILLVTNGQLSPSTLTLIFCLGTAFVAWNRAKRFIRIKQLNQLDLASRGASEERIVVEVFCNWKELRDNDRAWLITTGDKEEVLKGKTLIEEGEAVDALYIVLSGELEVCISALGDEKIAMLSAGDVVGEMSFVRKRLPSATVRSLEDSVVWSIPRSSLSKKLQQDQAFASRFYQALAGVLSDRLHITTLTQLSLPRDAKTTKKILKSLDSVGILSFSPLNSKSRTNERSIHNESR